MLKSCSPVVLTWCEVHDCVLCRESYVYTANCRFTPYFLAAKKPGLDGDLESTKYVRIATKSNPVIPVQYLQMNISSKSIHNFEVLSYLVDRQKDKKIKPCHVTSSAEVAYTYCVAFICYIRWAWLDVPVAVHVSLLKLYIIAYNILCLTGLCC